jgi:drug/metabolite transporter (DMT)-like permease
MRVSMDYDDILRPMNRQRHQSGVAKASAILLVLAAAIFLAGAVRYYRHGSFSLVQAGYCLVALVASLVVLLVFDYTLHHAKIAALMVLIFAVLFLVASPAFCIGMGMGLAGMVLSQSRS